jgi:hypothetical protein
MRKSTSPTVNNPNRRHDHRYFFKYVTASTAKAILRSRRLRWSSPQIFNDPFDTPRKLTFDCTSRELQEALAEELARLIETDADAPPNASAMLRVLLGMVKRGDRRRPEMRAILANDLRENALNNIPEPAVGLRAFQDDWDDRIPKMRVLCVSETGASTAMWAHYADTHRGAVLEFESADEVDSPLLIARAVRYQDKPPRLPSKEEWVESIIGRTKIDLGEFFSDYQYVKPTQWAYEKEWRVVSYARSGETGLFGDYPFFPEELRRVILGAACLESDEIEIRALVAESYQNSSIVRAHINHELRQIEF